MSILAILSHVAITIMRLLITALTADMMLMVLMETKIV